jgi:hypothetical protein
VAAVSGRTTVILLVVAAALGSYYYLGEMKGGAKRKEAKETSALVFPLKDSEVTGIRTVRGADTLVIRRAGGDWELVKPVEAAADGGVVSSAVMSLVEARREETLEGGATNLASYGLQPPALEVTVSGPAGSAARTLRLGDYNPTQSFAYAAWPDSNQVMLVSASARRAIDKSASEFRDRSVMSCEPADVRRVVIRRPEWPRDLVLEQAGGRWREPSPSAFRADKVTVETLLGTLGSTRVMDFVNENPADLAPYGLDRPRVTLRVESGKDPAGKVLLLGAQDPARGGHFARREGKPAVLMLPDDALVKSLAKDPAEYRAPGVVDFDQAAAKRIVLASADSSWTLVREELKEDTAGPGYAWKRKDNGAKLDNGKVNDLLWEMKRVRYAGVVSENAADPGACGFKPPHLAVTVFGEGEVELARFLLGGAREGHDQLYAMNGEEPVLYAIAKEAAATIPTSIDPLMEMKPAAAGK